MIYLRRAVKYFVQIALIFVVIIGILMLTGMVSKDVAVAFRNGWSSVWMIIGLFAVMSLVYPYFGYGKRKIRINGDPAPMWEKIDRAMESRGYVFCGHTPDGGRKSDIGEFRVFLNQAGTKELQEKSEHLQKMFAVCGIQSAWGSINSD